VKRRLRIVVADDEPLIRRYFQEILPELGHEVVAAAATGPELIAACRRTRPDLVISDIKMPEVDGIDVAREISGEQPVPFIIVSAYHDPDLIERAATAHVMGYLVKPIGRSDLETAIAVAWSRFEELRALKQEAGELRQALEERKLIERAKGVLINKTGLSEPDAFRRMQRMASDTNRKLVEVARLILAAEPTIELFRKEDA